MKETELTIDAKLRQREKLYEQDIDQQCIKIFLGETKKENFRERIFVWEEGKLQKERKFGLLVRPWEGEGFRIRSKEEETKQIIKKNTKLYKIFVCNDFIGSLDH